METNTVYQFTVKGRQGEDVSLADYKGKVLLIVNTATRCGFTPQYEGLEWMYDQHKDIPLFRRNRTAFALRKRSKSRADILGFGATTCVDTTRMALSRVKGLCS